MSTPVDECPCGRPVSAQRTCRKCINHGPPLTPEEAYISEITEWTEEDLAVLRWAAFCNVTSDQGALLLGISPKDYMRAIELWEVRSRGEHRDQHCLGCGQYFHSIDHIHNRICELCKQTDAWEEGADNGAIYNHIYSAPSHEAALHRRGK